MPELKPQLAELLRTCVHPPLLLLQVAAVQHLDLKHGHPEQAKIFDGMHRYATKFILSDGSLMIQALLHRKLSGLNEASAVREGDLLDVRRFEVRKAARVNGEGSVAYLAVEDCHFLLQSARAVSNEQQVNATIDVKPEGKRKSIAEQEEGLSSSMDSCASDPAPSKKRLKSNTDHAPTEALDMNKHDMSPEVASLFDQETEISQMQNTEASHARHVHQTTDRADPPRIYTQLRVSSDESDDDEPFFQQACADLETVMRRRRALQSLDANIPIRESGDSAPNAISDKGKEVTSIHVRPESLHDSAPAADSASDLRREESAIELLEKELDAELTSEVNLPTHAFPQEMPKRAGTFYLSQPTHAYSTGSRNTVQEHLRPKTSHANTPPVMLQPPPFHTLHSLRNPPVELSLPSKNYMITTLAFVSWTGTSLIHRPGSVFPPKRHLKIIDPSLSERPEPRGDGTCSTSAFKAQSAFQDAVTVAVYLDAAQFKPVAGTLALFRGLVMQRLANGDIILNAYGRLKDQRFQEPNTLPHGVADQHAPAEGGQSYSHWFITSHDKMRALGYGSKVDYYLDWWNERRGTAEHAHP